MPRKQGPDRPHRIEFRLTDAENDMLEYLRRSMDQSRSAVLRDLIVAEVRRNRRRKASAESARHYAGYVS